MAKIARKSAKIFAENAIAGVGGVSQFGSLATGNINYSKDVDVIQALQAYQQGWSSAVLGNKSPTIEDRNALDYLLSYQQAYIMQRGVPEWLASETYYTGSFVSLDNGRMYVSTTDDNTGNNPATDTVNWLAFPTPADLAALAARVLALESASHPPVGSLAFGPVNTMSGFLLCNGQAVSRTTYANLFAAIGTNFGAGDGSTTFNVPDYRGCFLRGLGGDSAASMYTKQPQGLPNHRHAPIYLDGSNDDNGDPGDLVITEASQYNGNRAMRNSSTGYVSDNSIYGAANEVRPVNFAVNYFIKY